MKLSVRFMFILLVLNHTLGAENKSVFLKYSSPVKLPYSFSGNFGEIRPDHFHSGLDFRTQGRTGIPVYAVKEGYISRISVSASGYGNALYITHPDGNTTLYGHLERFIPAIGNYVKDKQYYTQNFQVNLTLSPGEFDFKKGELIAWSGNSGSSAGPHLHFEVRDTKSEQVQNPMFYLPGIKDNSAPKIMAVYLYPLSETSHVNRSNEKKRFPAISSAPGYGIKNSQVEVYGNIGFGIQAVDYYNGAGMSCGIYAARLFCDGKEVFGFAMDKFPLDQTLCANSQADYEELMNSRHVVQRLYKQPGNEMRIYKGSNPDGVLELTDGKMHHIEIKVSDASGNQSVLAFNIAVGKFLPSPEKIVRGMEFVYDRASNYQDKEIKIKIPEGALYENIHFCYNYNPKLPGCISGLHQVHYRTVSLQKEILLSIKTDVVPDHLRDKCVIAAFNKSNDPVNIVNGEYSNGWVTGSVNRFGNFSVKIDSVPPSVFSLSISEKKILTNNIKLQFRITDNLSGIKSFRGEIDGKWVLFEYDAKSKTISHIFDKDKMFFGKDHSLVLTVSDKKDNKSIYSATFFR